MAAENESPARDPPAPPTRGRGRGRGGRGRGRGGGRGASSAAVNKPPATRGGRGGTRRGRAKNFSDSRVQAAYERQRDLKATYQAVAHALKPALQELAERNIDDMLQNPDKHKNTEYYFPVISQLRSNLEKRLAEHQKRFELDTKLAEDVWTAAQHVIEQQFQNGIQDLYETYFEGQENRLRILSALQARGLPVDIRDDQYEYKVISDEHLDNDFGIYEAYKDGYLVPYPSRVEGTEMWQKARDADAATAAAATTVSTTTVTSAPTRGRGRGRGGIKRRAMGDPDAQPTPKRSTRNTDDSLYAPVSVAPAPAKGLLASAAEADLAPEGTPMEDESPSGTPEPGSFYAAVQSKMPGKLLQREKSPPLPKNIAEPDEHGVRIYNQKPSLREKSANSRFLAPNIFDFEDEEIGFRDSSNDSTKGHTHAKRGKYLDTPNSNGMHFDHWCNAYDFSNTTPSDFNKSLVQRHGVHPKYGIFLPESNNDLEDHAPYVMPGKPVVFIANPSGRISHASRSFQRTINHNRSVDAPWRHKFNASLRRFCKMDQIEPEEIAVDEYLPTEDELKKRSLGTAVQEMESRPVLSESSDEDLQDDDAGESEAARPDLSMLTDAAAMVDAEAASKAAPVKKATKYDAVRDLFMSESKPAPPPSPTPDVKNLNFLADICNSRQRNSEWSNRGPSYPGPSSTGYHSDAYPPVSNERDSSYAPATPATRYRDSRMSMDAPQRHSEVPPSQSYYPSRHLADQPPESSIYGSRQSHELTSPHQNAPPHSEYKPAHAYPAPSQEHGGYTHSQSQGAYPSLDHRDSRMSQGRSYEAEYEQRRASAYASESPAYSRPYWQQQQAPPPAPPPPASVAQSQGYSLPPVGSSRGMSFSSHASNEPLPPLRPPRGRNQSAPEESMVDPAMRQPRNDFTQYYQPSQPSQPGSSRSFQSSYTPAEPPSGYQSRPGERMMPNPPPSGGQGYVSSPPQNYSQLPGSPTFGTMQLGGGPQAGSPESTTPTSIFRHRSTPSGSGPPSASAAAAAAADPNSKYRKLQPAPVPAHRAWTHKPELKTIPYDHKDSSGGAAALPNSGPTQIRGWNVNQHRRRNRSDKQDGGKPDAVTDREDSR